MFFDEFVFTPHLLNKVRSSLVALFTFSCISEFGNVFKNKVGRSDIALPSLFLALSFPTINNF